MYEEARNKARYGIIYTSQPYLQSEYVFFETEQERDSMVARIKETGKMQSHYHYRPDGPDVPVSNFVTVNTQECYRRIRTEGE